MKSHRKNTLAMVLMLIGCFIMSAIAGGLGTYQRTLYIAPIAEETGIARAALSTLFSLVSLTVIPITLNIASIKRRIGSYRGMAMIAFAVLACGLFAGSAGHAWWHFLIYGYGIQLAIYFGTTAPISGFINNWFEKNTGVIIGVMLAGGSLGGSLFAYLTGVWITEYGWRVSFGISGIVTVACAILCFFFLRDYPKGTAPPPESATELRKKSAGGFRLLKKRNYLFLGLATFFMMVGIQGMRLQSAPMLIDAGSTTIEAATILSIMMFISAAGSVAGGLITDLLGVRPMSLLILGSASVGTGCLLFAQHRIAQLGFAIFFGIGFCALNLMLPMHAATQFRPEERDDVFSIGFSFSCAGTFVGLPIISLYYEWVGSYTGVVLLFMAIFMVSLFFYTRVRKEPAEPLPCAGREPPRP